MLAHASPVLLSGDPERAFCELQALSLQGGVLSFCADEQLI